METCTYHHYAESGLDDVYLLNGFRIIESPRGPVVQIQDMEGLHRAIAMFLVTERKHLSGKDFRFLRHELNTTQQLLAMVLGVDVQTVGRWEKGRSEIPGPAQRLLRLIYQEHVGGNKAISEPLRKLAELDELLDGKAAFEVSEDEWQPAGMAA